MKQILIGGNVAYTAAATPSALTAGQIGVYAEDYTLITTVNVDTYKGKPFFIAAHSTLGPRITKPVHTIVNLSSNVYAVPVKQVVTISGVALNAVAPGKFDEYGVKVIDVSQGMSPSENRITYTAIGVFGTVAALVDRFVEIINGNKNSIVVASRATNDLVLTAKEFENRFRVATQSFLEAATITYTTPWSPGVGFGPRIVEIEKDFLAYEGHRNRIDARYPSPALQSTIATNYDVIVMDWLYTAENKSGMDAMYNRKLNVILAITAGAAQKTALDTILSGLNSLVGPQGIPGV